jgi:hypothetical protein
LLFVEQRAIPERRPGQQSDRRTRWCTSSSARSRDGGGVLHV